MSDNTNIEWCDATWNPILGCRKCASGCRNCYAVGQVHRMSRNPNPKIRNANAGLTKDGAWTGAVRFLPERLSQPLRWREPKAVFVCSLSDPFHPKVGFGPIMRILDVIAQTPRHQYLLLTKRPAPMFKFFSEWSDLSGEDFEPQLVRGPKATRERHPSGRGQLFAEMLDTMGTPPPGCAYPTFDWAGGMISWPEVFPNLWLGFSASTQAEFNAGAPDVMELRKIGWKTFLSLEPLCEAIALPMLASDYAPNGVIVGGESGPKARPTHPDWVRSIRDQCKEAGVAFCFKQWGEWLPVGPDDIHPGSKYDIGKIWLDESTAVFPVGKKRAGRLLDGELHDDLPWRRKAAPSGEKG
jgi:protein gp37